MLPLPPRFQYSKAKREKNVNKKQETAINKKEKKREKKKTEVNKSPGQSATNALDSTKGLEGGSALFSMKRTSHRH